MCQGYDCKKVAIPYVLRYMTNELAAMNIKMKFTLSNSWKTKCPIININ